MKNKNVYKWCFVPGCKNTGFTTPNKIFISVPREYTRKREWFIAAGREMPQSKSTFYCCEDHFKLEEDAHNFIRYKLMGGKIFMKPGVVPHLFDCQLDGKRTGIAPTRTLPSKKMNEMLLENAICEQASTSHVETCVGTSAREETVVQDLMGKTEILTVPITPKVLFTTKNVGVQARPYYRSKSTMCNIVSVTRHTDL